MRQDECIEGLLKKKPAILALSDGTVLEGYAIGKHGIALGELVFNTAMTGYQEIMTDPSYAGQIITFSYPHIGNTGINTTDMESEQIWASGIVMHHSSPHPSNWRCEISLSHFLTKQNMVGIEGVDTRHLVHLIREKGTLSCCINSQNDDQSQSVEMAREWPGLTGMNLIDAVTTPVPYTWDRGLLAPSPKKSQAKINTFNNHIVVYDFGVKRHILRLLVERGCRLTVVPAHTTAEAVLALQPDGIFLSNGPGDPAACDSMIYQIRQLLHYDIPIFGICMGHQLLALAAGAKTYKMKFGHHGANHPVYDVSTQNIYISSQNHGFAVDLQTLPDDYKARFISPDFQI